MTERRGNINEENVALPPAKRRRTALVPSDGSGNQNGVSTSRSPGQGNMSQSRRKGNPINRSLDTVNKLENDMPANMGNGHQKRSPKPKGPVHKRFDSEDPPAGNHLLDGNIAGIALNGEVSGDDDISNDSDSDNEEPETMTASAGLTHVRILAADAAKAVERQAQATREKRRKKDAQLKQQAAAARKQQQNGKAKRNITLPDLLPDELLEVEPVIRPTTPPLTITNISPKKFEIVNADPKPPKDMKRGRVKIRVLEESKTGLPPRVSKASKFLRESWLTGRRGRNNAAVDRKKVGGFLRTRNT